MPSTKLINMSDVMRKPAVNAVKEGPAQVELYIYDAVQIMAEISHYAREMVWQAKLALLIDLLVPLLQPIEKHWRNNGSRVNARVIFHPLTGEPGIQITEPATGSKRTIYGRKGDGSCNHQMT